MDRSLKTFLWSALPVLLLLAFAAPVVQAQSAGTWVRRGQTAEARGDYDTAFVDYQHAYQKHPKNLADKTHYERVRFQAAAQHVDQGRKLRAMGDPAAALTEYMRALEIDPSNQAAQQEIEETRKQQLSLPAPGQSQQMSQQDQSLKEIATLSSPVVLKPLSDEPITLHMVEDAKVIYQAIGKAAGLNVLFDPDFTSKRIPVDLTGVSLPDALRIVGAIAGTFWKPVTSNTIFVAQNTRTKRTDLDNLAVQTFYLTNAAQQNDANEVTTALRNLLDPSVKVYLVPSQNAIVMRATTDQLLLAQKLINDLDRTRPEVVVDVAVLEVSKQVERNLGITLPQTFGVGLQSLAAANTAATTNTTNTTTTNTASTSGLSLNDLGNLNARNFAVTVSNATANMLLTNSDTRVLQNPRIRATDGQRATLKIGSKIPVATGSYSAGTAASTVSLGVQTQFQYLDIGVNIDMTPTVHYDHEISLKMKIEVSTQSGSVNISGVTEPIISQRVVEQEIQLREGEPSILAGLLEQDNSTGVSGLPGLGELPLLKYFFSSQDKKNDQDEIVFLMIPHIVREQVLSPLNTRAVDTGTNQEIELRRMPAPPVVEGDDAGRNPDATVLPLGETSGGINPQMPSPNKHMTPQEAANTAVAGMSQQAKTTGGAMNASDAAATALGQMQTQAATDNANVPPLALNVMPPESSQTVGSTFQMAVMAANAKDVFSVPMQVQFNPTVLQLVNVDAGEMLGRDGQAVAMVHRDDGAGLVTITASRPPNVAGVNGQGVIATLTFRATGAGDAKVTLVKVGAKNSAQGNIATIGSQSVVHVK